MAGSVMERLKKQQLMKYMTSLKFESLISFPETDTTIIQFCLTTAIYERCSVKTAFAKIVNIGPNNVYHTVLISVRGLPNNV